MLKAIEKVGIVSDVQPLRLYFHGKYTNAARVTIRTPVDQWQAIEWIECGKRATRYRAWPCTPSINAEIVVKPAKVAANVNCMIGRCNSID